MVWSVYIKSALMQCYVHWWQFGKMITSTVGKFIRSIGGCSLVAIWQNYHIYWWLFTGGNLAELSHLLVAIHWWQFSRIITSTGGYSLVAIWQNYHIYWWLFTGGNLAELSHILVAIHWWQFSRIITYTGDCSLVAIQQIYHICWWLFTGGNLAELSHILVTVHWWQFGRIITSTGGSPTEDILIEFIFNESFHGPISEKVNPITIRNIIIRYIHRADSRFAPSQWETALLCKDVSHWLGVSLESVLYKEQANHQWIYLSFYNNPSIVPSFIDVSYIYIYMLPNLMLLSCYKLAKIIC